LSSTTGTSPLSSSAEAIVLPMNPAPPVMRTFTRRAPLPSFDHPSPVRTRAAARRLRARRVPIVPGRVRGFRPGKAFLRELLFEIDAPFRIS
jgi:hypothetical protein